MLLSFQLPVMRTRVFLGVLKKALLAPVLFQKCSLEKMATLLTNSMEQSPSLEANITQLDIKFPAFYGTRRFIIVLTTARHWSLSWARWIQSTPSHPISLRSIQIFSSHPLLGLPGDLFPSGFLHFSYVLCVLHILPSHPPCLARWSHCEGFEVRLALSYVWLLTKMKRSVRGHSKN